MKAMAFGVRNATEILRDPLTVAFSLGFPVAILLLLSAIRANVPFDLFAIERLAPGIAIFGLSFLTLFCATLIARDRESALLQRLYTAPLAGTDFIFGYALPMVPIALGQSAVCYVVAIALGLEPSARLLAAIAMIAPVSLFFIAMGLLCGSVFSVKQVGGICGALLTNVGAWLSGTWFDPDLVGGAFKKIAELLPFIHAVELERAILRGDIRTIPGYLLWVMGYGVAAVLLAVGLFLRQKNRQ